MKTTWIFLVLILVIPATVMALGPHEVLVLVNGESPDSVEIAKEFVRLRKVPEINVVRLGLPDSAAGSPAEISPEDFTRLIWSPATTAMRERGIEDHILAWVYSADFPLMVKTSPVISIQGLTFLRNKPEVVNKALKGLETARKAVEKSKKEPFGDDISRAWKALYSSPLFAGPDGPGKMAHFSLTFDVYHKWLGEEMPLPSMILGYTGEKGNTVKTVLKCLENGTASDGTFPEGTVYFVTSSDVRSTCRQWQYRPAQWELRVRGVQAVIGEEFPSERKDIIGLMMGSAHVNPEQGNLYLPGCMAEHLTSAAANFDDTDQTKLTAWIEAGVTASAGTVAEPFSIWAKFANARFFAHYASGCCIMESFFQSIRCPLQILLVGEPLAQPWAPRAEVILHGLEKETLSGTVSVRAEIKAEQGNHYSKFVFLLDGKVVGNERTLELDTTRCQNGAHTLRVVAYKTGLVRCQVFAERQILVSNSRVEAQKAQKE